MAWSDNTRTVICKLFPANNITRKLRDDIQMRKGISNYIDREERTNFLMYMMKRTHYEGW